jgi:hypothetical protein
VFPQLNAVGEAFRNNGLHGLKPAIEPIHIGKDFDLPGTFPFALALAFGEDVTRTDPPGAGSSTVSHFNLQFLSIVAGGELGPHLSFLADYAPLLTDTRTGEINVQTRPGLAFLQAHTKRDDWLGNLRLGLFELPVGTSPRVHRLTARPYLIYSVTAYRMLGGGIMPPVTDGRTDVFQPGATQIGGEFSARDALTGMELVGGFDLGSNNRNDNNSTIDVFARIGYDASPLRTGLFLYYSPDILGDGVKDAALRVGPDLVLLSRRTRVAVQLLAGRDSNPTNRDTELWFYGGFVEGSLRFTPTLLGLLRMDYAEMLDFDDRAAGGRTHVRRELWEATAGLQFLWLENVKVVAEVTYSENHEAVRDVTTDGVGATLRVVTAFWPLTPPFITEALQ